MVVGLLHGHRQGGGIQDYVPTAGMAEEIEKPRREPGAYRE